MEAEARTKLSVARVHGWRNGGEGGGGGEEMLRGAEWPKNRREGEHKRKATASSLAAPNKLRRLLLRFLCDSTPPAIRGWVGCCEEGFRVRLMVNMAHKKMAGPKIDDTYLECVSATGIHPIIIDPRRPNTPRILD